MRKKFLLFLSAVCLLGAVTAHAADLTSSHFIIRDPVLGSGGSFSTSVGFQLFANGDFVLTGRTPSSGSFLGHFGFLYFPFVTASTLSATPGDSKVDLSWTTADAGLGFSVSGYEYGVATASGGPFSYFNIGNVTSTSSVGLTNGTPYYFVVRALDAFGAPIATSNVATATPNGGVTPPPPNSLSGHFMGIRFIGFAYPQAIVSVLKNAAIRATAKADAAGAFALALQEPYDKSVLYTLYADDADHHRSLLLNYPLVGKDGSTTDVSGIKFAPTIVADKVATKQGDPVTISGFALPNTPIEFQIGGAGTKTLTTTSAGTGRYTLAVSSADLPKGEYQIKAHYPGDTRYTLVVQFTVGDVNIVPAAQLATIPGDCNADHAITLQDFSVLAYWYGKQNPPTCIDANHDGTVNLVDFSILAYYWNG